MATTTYDDNTFSVRVMGTRTNSGGTGVTDLTAEEDRLAAAILTGGWLLTPESFEVAKGATGTFNVIVGSVSSRKDYYVVPGQAVGQGSYIIRLAAKTTLALTAAHATNDRIDEVYLVAEDDAYDSNGRSLARLAVREGDAAVVPVVPGPDAGWNAYALLATVTLPAGSADISASTLEDERVETQLLVDASTLGGEDASFYATASHNHDTIYADLAHVDSDDGHPDATDSLDGFMSDTDKTKLNGIETGAEVNPTGAEILADLKTVDGGGSGLDADLLRGLHLASYQLSSHNHDSRYYQESEVDALVADKRNKPEAVFLKQTVTSGVYGSGSASTAPANAEERDDWGGHSGSTMVVSAEDTGYYLVTAQLSFQANSSGYRQMRLYGGGVGNIAIVRLPAISGDVTVVNASSLWYASTPGDTLTVELYQNSGSSLTLQANSTWMRVLALGH